MIFEVYVIPHQPLNSFFLWQNWDFEDMDYHLNLHTVHSKNNRTDFFLDLDTANIFQKKWYLYRILLISIENDPAKHISYSSGDQPHTAIFHFFVDPKKSKFRWYSLFFDKNFFWPKIYIGRTFSEMIKKHLENNLISKSCLKNVFWVCTQQAQKIQFFQFLAFVNAKNCLCIELKLLFI